MIRVMQCRQRQCIKAGAGIDMQRRCFLLPQGKKNYLSEEKKKKTLLT